MTGELWTSFNSQVMEYLQSVTLQDLVEQALKRERWWKKAPLPGPSCPWRPSPVR